MRTLDRGRRVCDPATLRIISLATPTAPVTPTPCVRGQLRWQILIANDLQQRRLDA